MPTLPKPYYSLPQEKPSFWGNLIAQTIIFLLFSPLVLGAPYFIWTDFVSIKDDIFISSHAPLALNPHNYYFHHATRYTNAHFCVSYDTQQGQHHSKCTELFFPFFEPDTNRPLVVHYDPSAPDHASTNWGQRMLFTRILAFLGSLLFCLFIEFIAIAVIIKKLTGKDFLADKPEKELCGVLDNLVSTLATQTNYPEYAKALSTHLATMADKYKEAIQQTHSTEDASRALAVIIHFIDNYRAYKLEHHIDFGPRYTDNLRKYEGLVTKLREANYGSDSA